MSRQQSVINMCMKHDENGFVLGGEQSGHIIFSKHARTGDGILTSLMLMEVIMEKKQSLGKLCSEVKIYPQLLQNVRVTDKRQRWKMKPYRMRSKQRQKHLEVTEEFW